MLRLRVRFCRGDEIKFISHLDLMRLWQRALRRAEIPLAYSQGFNPHTRLALAAPLAVGVTAQAELMDVFCEKWVSPHFFMAAVNRQLPAGIWVEQVHQVSLTLPSLQSQVRYAEYEVRVQAEWDRLEVGAAITGLLQKESLPWQHQRDTGIRRYDLRPLIDDIWLEAWSRGEGNIGMRLRCGSNGSGRPEQVAAALGLALPPLAIHRTKLILEAK